MAVSRKDFRGRVLRKGEVQRSSDRKYMYTYTDPLGKRKYIYANDLITLREKEKQLIKKQLDGLDIYVSGRATIDNTFDRYISTKFDLKETTKSNYMYMYDRYVRNSFGRKKIAEVNYSDILQYYYYLLKEEKLGINTLGVIHTLLRPTFQLAVRDNIIYKNPADGVMKEISRKAGKNKGIRHALTIEQQRAFMDYTANHSVYCHWWAIFTILLGTGCRVGEATGLRWEDLDFEKRLISINHELVYYAIGAKRKSEAHISLPKTEAGIRVIPMMDIVYDAFQLLYEEQEENGFNTEVIDGMSGFVFCNRYGKTLKGGPINKAIKRVTNSYNNEEIINAKKENREPLILPDFSCHHLRHTFCTRLCENESNLKVIQTIMGHKNIETTMDIYAEATGTKLQETMEMLSIKLDVF